MKHYNHYTTESIMETSSTIGPIIDNDFLGQFLRNGSSVSTHLTKTGQLFFGAVAQFQWKNGLNEIKEKGKRDEGREKRRAALYTNGLLLNPLAVGTHTHMR